MIDALHIYELSRDLEIDLNHQMEFDEKNRTTLEPGEIAHSGDEASLDADLARLEDDGGASCSRE
jgi:hypothetical protein